MNARTSYLTPSQTARALALGIVMGALLAPGSAMAQGSARRGGGAGGACRVDTTAEWYKRQKAFYTNPGETWSDDSLRRVLLAAAGYDANASFAPELGWRLDVPAMGGADAAVLSTLRAMASKREWPTRAMVGVAGVHAAWLVAQHDSAMSFAALHRMMEAGPGESSPAEVAVLEDARRVAMGRGQIHGTQFRKDGAKVVLAGHLEDSVHVDMRREGAWLPPIGVSECLAARTAGGR